LPASLGWARSTIPARRSPPTDSSFAEWSVGRNWELFADFKQLWLAVNAKGLLAGGVPVTAHVTLNPSLVSLGMKVRS
jgi:hypothetical protein